MTETATESKKDKILNNLQQAKETGQLKTENIREIVKNAMGEAAEEIKSGRTEISILIQDAIAAVTELFKDRKDELKEEITATIEGAVEGINQAKREAISTTQSQIQTLEAKVEAEEDKIQEEIEGALVKVESTSKEKSAQVAAAVAEAIEKVKDSEELALLQRRYAQLRAQLAVVQANLSSRYSDGYPTAGQYLEEAKIWYAKAKENPEEFTGKVEAKQQEVETKLGEAGSAIARKEKEVKGLFKDLLKSMIKVFRDKQ